MTLTVKDVAKIAHNLNKAYCESVGDTTQATWEETSPGLQESTEEGVKLHLANPSVTPEESHNAWLAERAEKGWTFGEEKDAVGKKHPCIVPWAELSPEWKAKDFIFKAVVDSLAPFIGAEDAAAAPAATGGATSGVTLVAVSANVPGTDAPTEAPTTAPTEPAATVAPTTEPTTAATEAPTTEPTTAPAATEVPTTAPTEAPGATEAPTTAPTEAATEAPTEAPTEVPTEAPSAEPTTEPTIVPPSAPEITL